MSREWFEFLRLRSRPEELNFPGIIGIGAARSGTTSLYHSLNSSDEIFMSPVKELSYFSNHYENWSVDDYKVFFSKQEEHHKYSGEISPHYLHSRLACERIANHIPNCKIVILLRNPVTRTISHFKHHYNFHKVPKIDRYFSLGLKMINTEQDLKFHHPVMNMRQSFYYDAVKMYLDTFPKDNVFIGTLDQMKANPLAFGNRLSDWLGVEVPIEREPKNKSTNIKGVGSLNPDIKSKLEELYSDDFEKTVNLLGISKEDLIV